MYLPQYRLCWPLSAPWLQIHWYIASPTRLTIVLLSTLCPPVKEIWRVSTWSNDTLHVHSSSLILIPSFLHTTDQALLLCQQAVSSLDFRQHSGTHPTLGVIDNIVFSPMGKESIENTAGLSFTLDHMFYSICSQGFTHSTCISFIDSNSSILCWKVATEGERTDILLWCRLTKQQYVTRY